MADGATLHDSAALCLDADSASSHHAALYNSGTNKAHTRHSSAFLHNMERPPVRHHGALFSDFGLSLLPGAAQGAATVLLGHPLDTAKTRMQTLGPHVQQSSFRTMLEMVSAEGVRSLYRGVTPPLIMQGLKRGVQFAFWDLLRRPSTRSGDGDSRAVSSMSPNARQWCWDGLRATVSTVRATLRDNPFLAGAAAGGAGTLLNCPMHVVKIQTQSQTCATTRNAWTCTLDIARKDGLRGYYRGFKFHVLKDMCFAGSYLGSYSALTRWLLATDVREMTTCRSARAAHTNQQRALQSSTDAVSNTSMATNIPPHAVFAQEEDMSAHDEHEHIGEDYGDYSVRIAKQSNTATGQVKWRLSPNVSAFIAGAGASMVTWTLFYPLDTLKTIMQAKQAQLLHRIRRDPLLLYRGLVASLIRAGPVSGVAMVMYEIVQRRVDARRGH